MTELPEGVELGARVVWRNGSHNYVAEKVGTVVFVGPKGWRPEKAPRPLKYWLDRSWRDTVRARRPGYAELCRMFPTPSGVGYRSPPDYHTRWRAPTRYKFTKCTSGIVVAVHEYRQLTYDTAQEKISKPKRPLLYAPSPSSLRPWSVGEPRPRFPKQPLGTWRFVVNYRYGVEEVQVTRGEQVMFEGRGANEKAARRECIKRVAEESRRNRSNFVIHAKGTPVDAAARRIDGAE